MTRDWGLFALYPGGTGKAAVLEGFRFAGIEREAEYLAIAERRIAAAVFGGVA